MPPDPVPFADLLERHRGILAKVAGSYARQREDREDLMQEIAVQLWRAWPSYDPSRAFSTWMYRIALNVAISQLRGRMRAPGLAAAAEDGLDALPDPAPHDPERSRQLGRLYRFIHALPPLERALMLLYLEERPQREIAEVLGLSETNVATKIGRLKARLRNEL
ncbi:sigma-70 family RNA polymerase sigma factor [Stenotrophomonas sp. MYb238]|uniref:RNA polymerase sigma factor n=1 Tax=Stenotrophomonas sp. MYb238 TaxID=2040281 RepID=UPI0012928FC9|nr:sigma-70 family RNA polymerase sigma factor [Stenotrophomonas sp. MYb238]MQP77078.1 sigma-70 family RNA polymerase sigma factor [Stenotrophomonas sp. MYb238]